MVTNSKSVPFKIIPITSSTNVWGITHIRRNLSQPLWVREGEGIDLTCVYFTGYHTKDGVHSLVGNGVAVQAL